MDRRHRMGILLCWGMGLLVSACALLNQPALAPTPPLSEDSAGGVGDSDGPSTPTEPPPFKSELVICASDEPDAIIGSSDPLAAALLPLVVPQAALFGPDYSARPGPLLTTLPASAEGTLSRNDDGTLAVTLYYNYDLIWSDGTPFSLADVQLGLLLPPSPFAPAFDVLSSQEGAALIVTAAPGAEYPYVPTRPPLPVHILGSQADPLAILSSNYARLVNPALGPYYVDEWVSGSHILFRANPFYPAHPAAIPVARLRFIPGHTQALDQVVAGNCDLILDQDLDVGQYPSLLEAHNAGQAHLYAGPGSLYERVVFNTFTGPFGRPAFFADPVVRRAFTHAFDRATLSQQAFAGISPVMDSWIAPGHWAYPAAGSLTTYPYDPSTASVLLDQAGWQDRDGDGVREYHGAGGVYACQRGEWAIAEGTALTPTLIIPADDPLRSQIAEKLRLDLAQIGVELRVQPLDPALMFSIDGPLTRRDFDLALFAAVTRPDPGGISQWVGVDVYRHPLDLSVVHRWQLEDRWLTSEQQVEVLAYSNVPTPENDYQGQNFAGWCNEQANIAIVEANLALDIPERQPFYAVQQAIFSQELPMIPLFYRPRLFLTAPYLCGLQPTPFGPITWNVVDWYFDASGACDK